MSQRLVEVIDGIKVVAAASEGAKRTGIIVVVVTEVADKILNKANRFPFRGNLKQTFPFGQVEQGKTGFGIFCRVCFVLFSCAGC